MREWCNFHFTDRGKKLTTKSPHSLQLTCFLPFSLALLTEYRTAFCTSEIHTTGTSDGSSNISMLKHTHTHFSVQETTAYLGTDAVLSVNTETCSIMMSGEKKDIMQPLL